MKLNPNYKHEMKKRRSVQSVNRDLPPWRKLKVPPQPNKYLPHYGAKEAAKYAGVTDLGALK